MWTDPGRPPHIDMRAPLHERSVRVIAATERGPREVEYDATDGRAPRWRWRGCLSPWRILAWRPMPSIGDREDVLHLRLAEVERKLAAYRAAAAAVLAEVAGPERPSDPDSYLPPRMVDLLYEAHDVQDRPTQVSAARDGRRGGAG